jgi:tRNA nucleotidyltransferase/poly(A) polymerase
MEPSLGLMMEGVSLAKSIAEFFGVLDSIDSKVDRLIESELKTGILELQQAANSASEKTELLRSARQRFNKAISLETGYKLCLAHVGVAICHSFLADHANARKALEDALAVTTDIRTRDWVLATLSDTYNPLSAYNPKRIKAQLRDTFKLQKNFEKSMGLFKKEAGIGLATEKMIDDRRKLIALQALAKSELTTC